jgi:hypothetical protein
MRACRDLVKILDLSFRVPRKGFFWALRPGHSLTWERFNFLKEDTIANSATIPKSVSF